jgi:hypothetical protein
MEQLSVVGQFEFLRLLCILCDSAVNVFEPRSPRDAENAETTREKTELFIRSSCLREYIP